MSSKGQLVMKEERGVEEPVVSLGDIAIRASGVSKCYHLYDKPQDRLKQAVFPQIHRLLGMPVKTYAREFWALKDVSFEVKKGETVGIIGRNGSGKSTLLQIIAGTLEATQGDVQVNGRVSALLELGSGFNPDFSGSENVYINAAIQGLSKTETDSKFDDIAAFADIGDFIEQPVKTYSSGMLMRLAFAVNACIEPDILVVDEALGVGDAPFQSKCYKRLRRLVDNGKSVLFVSHDISTVRSICSRGLWLKKGRAELWGDAKAVSKEYERFCWQEQGVVLQASEIASEGVSLTSSGSNALTSAPSILFKSNPTFESNRQLSRMGTRDVIIRNFLILNADNYPVTSCDYNEELTLYYLLDVCKPVDSDFVIGVWFRDVKGNSVYSANDLKKVHRLTALPGESFVVSAKLRIPLTHQEYVLHTSVFGFNNGRAFSSDCYDFEKAVVWDMTDNAAYIKVRQHKLMPVAGPVGASFELKIERA